MPNKKLRLLLFAILLPVMNVYALPMPVDQVVKLLSEQFTFSRKVAVYKYENNIPVYLQVRERVIMHAALQQAKTLGFDTVSARAFIRVQLNIINQIQLSWVNFWKKHAKVKPVVIQSTLQLQQLSIKMNEQLWQAIIKAMPDLRNPAYQKEIESAVQQQITQRFIRPKDKQALVQTLTGLKLRRKSPVPAVSTTN